MQIGFITNFIR